MSHGMSNKPLTDDTASKRKFHRQARRVLYRLATNGLGLRRCDFSVRVRARDYIREGASLVALQTEHWYIAVSAPLRGGGVEVIYAPCSGRSGRRIGLVQYARIDSVFDVHSFARLLRPVCDD